MLRVTLKSLSTICIFTRSHKMMWVSYVNGTPTHSKRDTKYVTNWPPYLWNHPFLNWKALNSKTFKYPNVTSQLQEKFHGDLVSCNMFTFSIINLFSSVISFLGQSSNADFIIQCKFICGTGKKKGWKIQYARLKFPGWAGRLRYMYMS